MRFSPLLQRFSSRFSHPAMPAEHPPHPPLPPYPSRQIESHGRHACVVIYASNGTAYTSYIGVRSGQPARPSLDPLRRGPPQQNPPAQLFVLFSTTSGRFLCKLAKMVSPQHGRLQCPPRGRLAALQQTTCVPIGALLAVRALAGLSRRSQSLLVCLPPHRRPRRSSRRRRRCLLL